MKKMSVANIPGGLPAPSEGCDGGNTVLMVLCAHAVGAPGSRAGGGKWQAGRGCGFEWKTLFVHRLRQRGDMGAGGRQSRNVEALDSILPLH